MKKRAYLVGIKGVGMTAVAVYLKEAGWLVEGSDVSETFPTDAILKKNKISVKKGFIPENINKKYDVVIATGAHGGMKNCEVKKASKMGFRTVMHGRFLGELMKGKLGISVAGCHGKTTTAAMIASVLTCAGLDPSYAIGTASINNLGACGHYGTGKYFVAEADEYMTCPQTDRTPRFMWQKPSLIVITNIEFDHPDVYNTLDDVKSAFSRFIKNLPSDGTVITCIDNKNVSDILGKITHKCITYGFSPRADFQITRHYTGDKASFFRVKSKNIEIGEFMIKVPGIHNMLNSLGTSLACHWAGLGFDKIIKCLKNFTGSKRRFELIAQVESIDLYDDYAHHPSEIAATLSAAKKWFSDRRILVIFQPHTFSRTKRLLPEFAACFKDADMAFITDIYPSARESYDSTISSKILVTKIKRQHKNVFYISGINELADLLPTHVRDRDIIMTMGAGDIYLWQEKIKDALIKRL